jgi:hypothetical protein
MGGDQDGAVDPAQHHVEESNHNAGRDRGDGNFIRNLTNGQKGISKPTTTTGVAGAIEICDIDSSSVSRSLCITQDCSQRAARCIRQFNSQ